MGPDDHVGSGNAEADGLYDELRQDARGVEPATIKGLLPNETYYYQTVGEDANVKTPEMVGSEMASFSTGLVSPQVVGAPGVSFVKSFSAVMSGELNPENASTRFAFQYSPTQACVEAERVAGHPVVVGECPGVLETGAGQSSEYARLRDGLEARGLQPDSGYRFRLVATSENGAKSETREGAGPEGAIPDSAGAGTRRFERSGERDRCDLGGGRGHGERGRAARRIHVRIGSAKPRVRSTGSCCPRPPASGAVPVEETLPLTGLQPGTTYAYRIAITSSYGTSYGETMTFTTTGLPAVLVEPTVLQQVPIPAIAFPAETPRSTAHTKSVPKKCATRRKLSHGKCVSASARRQSEEGEEVIDLQGETVMLSKIRKHLTPSTGIALIALVFALTERRVRRDRRRQPGQHQHE